MTPFWRSPRFLVACLLVAAIAARLALVGQGGQFFFPDEERFNRGVRLYLALIGGDFGSARSVLAQPDHAGFYWLTAALTSVHHLFAQLTPWGDWRAHPEQVQFTIWIGASLLALFSAANIYLVYRLARAAGRSAEEATWAALLLASSNTAFYHARHLLPYDCAVTAMLAALVVGLGAPTPRRAFACGLLTGACYALYNGYWFLVPVTCAVYLLATRDQPRIRLRFGALIAGLTVALGAPLALGYWLIGDYYWVLIRAFGSSATQGLFSECWSLPWEYLWHSEGWLGVTVLGAIIAAFLAHGRTRPPAAAVSWAVALLGCYGLLVLGSVPLERFVVYGRSVKPLVPFFCLLGGWAFPHFLPRVRRLKPLIGAGIALAGLFNLHAAFLLVFPREFEIAVLRHFGNPKHTLSVTGSLYTPLAIPVARPDLALVNAQLLYPIIGDIGYPAGTTLLKAPHPLLYRPYQYEGFLPREREFLREKDVAMRLIRLARPEELPDDLPLAHRARLEDRHRGR